MTSRRERSSRASSNDRALLEAAAVIGSAEGFGALNARRLAAECGLSPRPAYERFPTREAIGVALFEAFGAKLLTDRIGSVVRGLLDRQGDLTTSIGRVNDGFTLLTQQSDENRLLAEFFVAGLFCDPIQDLIRDALDALLREEYKRGDGTAVADAHRHYAVLCAVGVLLGWNFRPDLDPALDFMARCATQTMRDIPEDVAPLPSIRAEFMALRPFTDGDPVENALLYATLVEVGRVGYQRATVANICQRAGISQGMAFTVFPRKIDFLSAALARRHLEGLNKNHEFYAANAAVHGEAVADAISFRELMHPDHQLGCRALAEKLRASWRSVELQQLIVDGELKLKATLLDTVPLEQRGQAAQQINWSIGLGWAAELYGSYYPEAWKLPFHQVLFSLKKFSL